MGGFTVDRKSAQYHDYEVRNLKLESLPALRYCNVFHIMCMSGPSLLSIACMCRPTITVNFKL